VFTWKLFIVEKSGLGFSKEEGDIEREGGEETHIEQHYDDEIPLPRHSLPANLLLQLQNIKLNQQFLEISSLSKVI
jgi:hypothetical protein